MAYPTSPDTLRTDYVDGEDAGDDTPSSTAVGLLAGFMRQANTSILALENEVGIRSARGVFDVRNYGGVGNTNDTPSFQAAAAAAAAAGGGVVTWKGTANLTTALPWIYNASLRGFGPQHSLLALGGNIDGLQINVGATKRFNLTFADFGISSTTNRTAGAAIRAAQLGNSVFDNITINNGLGGSPYTGVSIENGSSQLCFRGVRVASCANNGWTFLQTSSLSADAIIDIDLDDNCRSDNNTANGIFINNQATNVAATIEGIYINAMSVFQNTGFGVRINPASGMLIKNVLLHGALLDTNTGGGLLTEGAGNVQCLLMNDVWVSANVGKGVFISPNASMVKIRGGRVLLNQGSGIWVQSPNVEIAGVTIHNNTSAGGGQYGIILDTGASGALVSGSRLYNDSNWSTQVQNGIFTATGLTGILLSATENETAGTRVSDSATGTKYLAGTKDNSGTRRYDT